MLKFRLGSSVPADSVGIALVTSPELSVRSTVQTFDLSHRQPANLAGDGVEAFPVSAGIEADYDDVNDTVMLKAIINDIDTPALAVTNRATTRRGTYLPHPLFFYYLIGRGIHYVYHKSQFSTGGSPDFLTALNKFNQGLDLSDNERQLVKQIYEDISEELQLVDRFGQRILDVSYDIGAIYPATLATDSQYVHQAYRVVLLISHKCGPDRTICLRYNQFDGIRNAPSGTHQEVVNAKPVMTPEFAMFQDYENPASELKTDEYLVKVKINDLYRLASQS